VGLPALVRSTGVVTVEPCSGITSQLPLDFCESYAMSKTARPDIVLATDLAPYVVPFETITKARVLVLRVWGGSITAKLTSAAGIKQAFNVSKLLVWHSPNAGDELTALELVGTAEVEYLLAGDTA